MIFYTPKHTPVICDNSNPEFVSMITSIDRFAKNTLDQIHSLDDVTEDLVTTVSDQVQELLITKTDSDLDYLDDTKYPDIFSGPLSQITIDIFQTLQDICQIGWNLDSYSTLELADAGVNQEDKQNFLANLQYLHNQIKQTKISS